MWYTRNHSFRYTQPCWSSYFYCLISIFTLHICARASFHGAIGPTEITLWLITHIPIIIFIFISSLSISASPHRPVSIDYYCWNKIQATRLCVLSGQIRQILCNTIHYLDNPIVLCSFVYPHVWLMCIRGATALSSISIYISWISPTPMTYSCFHSFDFLCLYSSCHACYMARTFLFISYSYTFVLALPTIDRRSHLTVVYESHFLSSCHRHLVQRSIHPSLIYIASLCGRSQPSASKLNLSVMILFWVSCSLELSLTPSSLRSVWF